MQEKTVPEFCQRLPTLPYDNGLHAAIIAYIYIDVITP